MNNLIINPTALNVDLFCCSPQGQAFRQNVLQKQCGLFKSADYLQQRNYDVRDTRSILLKTTGLAVGPIYTFTPQSNNPNWCNTMRKCA